MKRPVLIILSCIVASAATLPAAEIRYEDVIYLDQVHAKPLPLKVLRDAKLTVSRDQSTLLAYLEAGQTVWLLGFSDTRYYAETIIPSGKARGWVNIEAVERIPDEVRAEIEQLVRAAKRTKELIAKKQIEVGMSKEQVQAALGKPDERSRTVGEDRVEEQWTYRTYKSVPQRDYYYVDGKMFERAYYTKVLAGGKTVTFRNDEVVSIQDEDKAPQLPAHPVIVAPPPMIYRY
jgi:hypothetical protein